jgi:intracellular multiplication protein IcmO
LNLYLTTDGRLRHETVTGKSGAGKTEYMKHRLAQQIRRGGGAFILDSKEEYAFRDELWSLCRTYGREDAFRCVNINNAAESHTYNPLLRGDAVAVASRFTDTVDVGRNASAEHFRAQSNLALTAALTAIKSTGLAYNAKDLFILLSNPEAMDWFLRQLKPGDARQSFDIWLESFRHFDPAQKRTRVNTQQLRNQIGGVISRLFIYSVGEMGKVLNSYQPEVDLLDDIDHCRIDYFMIPALDKSEAALAFAKLWMSDMRSTLAQLYRRPKSRLPAIPHQVWMDEFGSYANRLVAQLFEMARGARVALVPMFQTYANLLNVSEDFADQVIGNSEVQTFLQLGDPNTCEWAANVTGEILRKFRLESRGNTRASGNVNLALDVFHNTSKSQTESLTTREDWDYRVRPEEFSGLEVGEAIVFVKGAKSGYKVKFPRIEPKAIEAFQLIRYETPERPGMNLAAKFETEFSSFEYEST